MKKAKRLLFVSVLRGLALSIFLSVFLIILYFLLSSGGIRKTGPHQTPPRPLPSGQKIEQQTKVRFVEFKGDLGRIEIKAERHIALDEQRYRLEGKVEIHDFGRRPGLESWISAEEAVYDADWSGVILTGKVSMKRQGIEIAADKVIYRRQEESLEAEGGVNLRFRKLHLEAHQLFHSFPNEVINLRTGVKAEWKAPTPAAAPYRFLAESLFYDRKQHKGRLEGGVRFFQGENSGEAGWAEFLVSEDELYLLKVELGGGVKGEARIDSASLYLEASHLLVKPFVNSHQPHALEANGAGLLKWRDQESETLFAAENLAIILDRRGKLRELKLEQEAQWKRQNLASNEVVEGQGEKIDYLPQKRHLEIKSLNRKKASLLSERVGVTAEEMTLNIDTQDLEARGEVQLEIKPVPANKEIKSNLFSEEKPVYGRASLLLYQWQQHRLVLEGRARLWQEETSLQADRVILDSETQELEGHGQVKMVAVRKAKKEASTLRLVQVAATQLRYVPATKKLHFVGPCEMGTVRWRANSGEVVISLAEESSDPEKLEAKGGVNLIRNGTRAAAEKGMYEWEKDVFVLEGNPVLEDSQQGRIRGDKLTFYLTDGKILVENQGRERSLSVIKKEK